MRTTIRHVSDRAGVSVGTVSNVLNAPHLVSAETTSRVREAIAELDYRPSRSARSLQAQRTYLIGYRLPDPGVSSALDVFLHSLVTRASDHGLEIVLFSPSGGQSDLDAYRSAIRSGDVDGFVLSETNYEDERIGLLMETSFPFVAFGRARASKPFSWVDVDGASGMTDVVDHLVELGHRRIALVAWPPGSESGDGRVAGYLAAMARAGLAVEPELMIRADGGFESGRKTGWDLLRRRRRPTAIVTVQDDLAFGVMAAAADHGIRVGPDLALTGFDDSPAAAMSTPGLTSVRQPMELVAATMIELLVSQLQDPETQRSGRLLVPDVVIRDSTPGSAAT
ncbi:LacI family DNA-binding transcriptional regulator [soil metagenome]